MKNHILLFIFFTASISTQGLAQLQDKTHPELRASTAYMSFGGSISEANPIGQNITVSNQPRIQNNQFNAGFGGGVFFDHFYFGAEGVVYFGNSNDMNQTSGYGLLKTGYILYRSKNHIVYPAIGIGGGGTEYLHRTAEASISVQRGLEPGTKLNSSFMVLSLELNSNFFLKPNVQKGNLVMGITGGYNLSPISPEWSATNRKNIDNLNQYQPFDISGPYLRIRLGWGAKNSQKL